jgi:hypothetical protein
MSATVAPASLKAVPAPEYVEVVRSDLMIAATAISEDLPLYTTNPGDYAGLEKLVRIVPLTRPPLPHEKRPDRG